MLMPSEPPVVMLMTASQLCLMRGRNCMKTPGSGVGLPFLGSRACRWMIEAPASAAAIESRAISSGVIGRYGVMLGVCTEPVTAQVMITLRRWPDRGQCRQLPAGRIQRVVRPLDLGSDVVEIEASDQRSDRRDQKDRADHERQPAQPFDRRLDPVRPLHEMAEGPFHADDQQRQERDGEAYAFEQHRAEWRGEHFPEGLTCGG